MELEDYIQSLQQGDTLAFDEVYNLTQKSVFSICYAYTQNKVLAEDMMQDTYINVWKYALQYRKNTNAMGWICTIARNICLNELKKRKREVIVEMEDIDPVSVVYNYEEPEIIRIAKLVLNENELKIVFMHAIGDISLKDIAYTLNRSQGTVRWQYNNALNKIRKYLGKEQNYEE